MFLSETCLGTKFREFASIFFPRTGISSIFLLCGTVRNGIPTVFCSAEWFRTESQEFASIFVPWYRIPRILLLCGSVRKEFREFYVPRNSRNSARTNQLFRLFRLPRNNFLSEGASKTPYTIIHPNQRPLRSPKQQRIKPAKSPAAEVRHGRRWCH
jgi:hypothetical protein